MIVLNELLTENRKQKDIIDVKKIIFSGVSDQDVYNVTAPFVLNGKEIIAGRVEARDSEQSFVGFFEQQPTGVWKYLEETVVLHLQDPFVCWIDDTLHIGGVEVFFEGTQTRWRTIIYKIINLKHAEKVVVGPMGMKDLRLKQLENGQILALTRPQGDIGGRGKIGLVIVDSLKSLTPPVLASAPLLFDQFNDEEWGGANEIHLIGERIFVLGHIANFDDDRNRHYYAMTFEIDQENMSIINAKIIAERSDFLPGPAKRSDLSDVVFSGGIELNGDTATLYAGISDVEAQQITIKNPFK